MGKSIVITSGKGGVGKSTAAGNIAAGLAFGGRRVLLVDMDIGLRSLDLMLGAENDVVYDLVDVVQGVCPLEQALYRDRRRENLFLLPASQQTGSSAVTPEDMRALARKFKGSFDYVIFDCPAGVGRGFRNACAAADSAILVITPDPVCVRDAERVRELLKADGITDMQLLINRVARRNPLSTDECIHLLDLPVLGFIPEDPAVGFAAAAGSQVLDRETSAGDAFERVARRLLGETIRYRIPHDRLTHRLRTGFGKEASCKKG